MTTEMMIGAFLSEVVAHDVRCDCHRCDSQALAVASLAARTQQKAKRQQRRQNRQRDLYR